MQENIIIEFSTDISKLTPAIDELVKIGKVTEGQAAIAKKMAVEYKAQQDAIAAGTRASAAEIEKFSDAYKNLIAKVTNGAINNTFKDIVDAMKMTNPEAAKLYTSLSNIKDAEAFVGQAANSLKQQLKQLADEGKKDTAEYNNLSTALDKLEKEMKDLSLTPKPDVSPDGKSEEKIKSARTRLKELREELMQLEDAGQVDTTQFQKLAEEAGELTDQIGDTQEIINYLGSDTKGLDALTTGASGLAGAFSFATSAGALLGGESEKLQEAFYKVQAAMAMLNGAMAVANALNKTSPLVRGIVYMQSKMVTAATNAQTGATVRLTVAQKIFNWIASLNPYLLLVTGIGLLIGAILWLVSSEDKATKAQIRNNEITKVQIEEQKRHAEAIKNTAKERESAIEHELNLLKARGTSETKIAAKEKELAGERVKNAKAAHERAMQENGDLNANIMKVEGLQKALHELDLAKADKRKTVEIAIDGEIREVDIDDEDFRKALEGKLENFTAKVEIQTNAEDALEQANKDEEILLTQQKQKRIDLAKKAADEELNIRRQAIDAEIKLIDNEQERREAEMAENFARQKEDLEKRRQELKKDGVLTAAANNEINALLASIDEQHKNELDALNKEFAQKRLDEIRASEDIQLSLMAEGYEKQRKLTATEYDRQIKDLKDRLVDEKGLIKEQREEINKMIINLEKKREQELAVIKRQQRLAELNDEAQAQQDSTDEMYNNELVALAKQHADGLIKEKEYDEAKIQMQQEYSERSINNEIESIESKLREVEAGSIEEEELQKQLADAKKQLAKENADYEIAEAERSAAERLAKEMALKDALRELQSAAFDMANELSQMFFDNEKARLDQQLADLDKFYTTDAEEAAKNKNLKLISEEELARKQAEIKNKQAAAEKQAAYIQAVINAAKSITQVFASTPPPASFILAAITAATTAIQIAKIASSPVPKYARGRKGGRGEYALTGELGPEIMWIPAGASVIPAHKSKRLMEGMRIAGEYKTPFPSFSLSNIDVSGLKEGQRIYIDYDKLGRAVADNLPPTPEIRIPEIRQLNVNMDENGFTKFVSEKTGKTVILNARG
ncbi:MAG: hypothetical protein LBS43_09225 [Prevotellaceae bacterium]|jgi:hypothetical protein|nr:hypothetical protein [Prevotellaceae bacterium]